MAIPNVRVKLPEKTFNLGDFVNVSEIKTYSDALSALSSLQNLKLDVNLNSVLKDIADIDIEGIMDDLNKKFDLSQYLDTSDTSGLMKGLTGLITSALGLLGGSLFDKNILSKFSDKCLKFDFDLDFDLDFNFDFYGAASFLLKLSCDGFNNAFSNMLGAFDGISKKDGNKALDNMLTNGTGNNNRTIVFDMSGNSFTDDSKNYVDDLGTKTANYINTDTNKTKTPVDEYDKLNSSITKLQPNWQKDSDGVYNKDKIKDAEAYKDFSEAKTLSVKVKPRLNGTVTGTDLSNFIKDIL